MSRYHPLSSYRQPLSPNASSLVELGKLGAVVGLCGAGAHNLRRLRRDEIEPGKALADTLRVGVVSGLATATAGLVASALRPSSLLALAATLATGTAVMYALNQESDAPAHGDDHV